MSASGQGDQIEESSKDDDGVISSTTTDNGGGKLNEEDVSGLTKIDAEAIPITAESTPDTSEAVDATPVILTTKGVDDVKVASTSTKTESIIEDNTCGKVTDSNIPELVEDNEPKLSSDTDENSGSVTEDLKLVWEEDDTDGGIDEASPDDVLKQLDQIIGDIEYSQKAPEDDKTEIPIEKPEPVTEISELANTDLDEQLDSNEVSNKTVKDLESSDQKNNDHDMKITSSDDSNKDEHDIETTLPVNDENSKIPDCDDEEMAENTSDKAVNLEKPINISSFENIEKPDTCDEVEILTKAISNQDIFREKDVMDKPCKNPMKIESELITASKSQDVEMDIDTEIISKESKEQKNLTECAQNKEVINEDIQQEISEISKEVTHIIKNKDHNNIKESSNINVVENYDSANSLTPSDNLHVDVPIEVLKISDIVETSNTTSKGLNETVVSEKVSEVTQDADCKKVDSEFDDNEITNVDENISQITDDSILDTAITPNVHHRINKPNVMLDIPTQELSDIEAELDDDDDDVLEMCEKEVGNKKIQESSPFKNTSENTTDIIKSKDQIDNLDNITSKSESMSDSSIVDSGAELSKDTVSPTKSDLIPSSSSFIQDIPSTLKLLQLDDKTSTSILEEHNDGIVLKPALEITDEHSKLSKDGEKHLTSKLTQGIDKKSSIHEIDDKKRFDDEKPITSKTSLKTDEEKPTSVEIDDEKPTSSKTSPKTDHEKLSTSKSTQEIDDEKPSTSKSAQKVDDEKPTTSKTSPKTDDEKPSTSKSTQEIDDAKPSTSKTSLEIDDAKPSTSKQDSLLSEILTADNADEELTDSLGLLAESSRVMDDDNDDDEDPEADDNDDDDDFDPYEETNSEMAEDMEESSTPPPDMDPKLDKPEPSPKVQEGSDEGTMEVPEQRESDEGTMDIAEGSIDIVDDIECEEDEPEIIDADKHVEKKKTPPEKVANILETILGGPKKIQENNIRNFVELDGSSDSDDVLEVSKSDATEDNVVSVNIPKGVEVMSTSGPCSTSEIVSKEGEVIISGVPKPPPQKMSKINTSEVSIKTASSNSAIHIPETTSTVKTKTDKDEIFNLDSDEEECKNEEDADKKISLIQIEEKVIEEPEKVENPAEMKCINPECPNEDQTYYQADRATSAYYSLTRRTALVCEQCRQRVRERNEGLIDGIKDLRPLVELEMDAPSQQLVEISDSDSEGEVGDETSYVGERDARFIEENLLDMINETWVKFNMEARLQDTERFFMNELDKIEADAKAVDAMLDECQKQTDTIRVDFYKDYEPRRKYLRGIVIHDTPFSSYSHVEKDMEEMPPVETFGNRYPKRRASSVAAETPAKRPAIPLGYAPLDTYTAVSQPDDQIKPDDDKEDISVVKLSAEAAPADLPPCGEITRPPLKTGMIIYAMRNAFGTWLKGRVMEVLTKPPGQQFTQCRVKFEHKVKNPCKVLPARCLAYPDPSEVRMTIGTRVVALFKDPHNTARRESFYSGVIAEIPNPVNSYRYLVFFDDGYAQYVRHQDTRIVCESSNLVWEEVHPFIRDFICNYLLSYPERPMVRLHAGEKLKTEWNGKWWDSNVLKVDASIALIHFEEDNRTEWIYRGSTRLAPLYLELQAAEKAGEGKTRSRAPRSKAQMRSNMPCVEYTRSDEPARVTADTNALRQREETRRKTVAKKSTMTMATPSESVVVSTPTEGTISRVVYYTPKNAVKPHKMSPHTCSIKCRRSDLLSLKELRTYNPLSKPLLSGWERQTVRYKCHRIVFYRAPCGRRLRNISELHKYLNIIQSDMSVDLFDFTPGTHCLSEFVLSKCIVSKKDLSHSKENVPVPCVNYYDNSLPEFCSYNTERTPTAGVPLNLDPEFLCGCDCTDDCADKSKCACWKMTLEGARTIGLDGPNVGYEYRRLPEPLPSGIYECNSRCKCKQTCLNRVAQHPLQLKLQVFKTMNRGWGIRALNDIPKGSFVCVYAGNLLTDATANLDGINEGDEYLAELDYIEVVEGMKEGYETDVPDEDKKLDKKGRSDDSDSVSTSESEAEEDASKRDGDFQPGYILNSEFLVKKSLRKREKAKKKEEEKQIQAAKKNDCITISDDEEVREPSRFTAQAGMVDRDLITKQSSRVSVRTLYGKDEACYIMDAKVQGNIGRYLNHSCHPNVFVQNVFVDTHDPRFPWVAFFALSLVRAGTELTWNYNYDIGSVPEKVLYCYCGAPNCRGRLL